MTATLTCTIAENRRVADDTYWLDLRGNDSTLTMPGQFVNLAVPGFFLRRPISVCSTEPGHIHLLYKTVGAGTRKLAEMRIDDTLEVLSGCGRGFTVPSRTDRPDFRPVLVGGGIGVAPLLGLAKVLVNQGIFPEVVFGFRTASEVTLVDQMGDLGLSVHLATEDGSAGAPGFVTAVVDQLLAAGPTAPNYLYTCGPTPMMKALFQQTSLPGQFSLEERMGCGFGACMGCVHRTHRGMERVCKEGPVFDREELTW